MKWEIKFETQPIHSLDMSRVGQEQKWVPRANQIVVQYRTAPFPALRVENDNENFRLAGTVFEILPIFWCKKMKMATENTETKMIFLFETESKNDFSLYRTFSKITVFIR